MDEKRIGMGPIPTELELYINPQQVHGMSILKLFGWHIVCIRRPIDSPAITIMKNREENAVGLLKEDGTLRLSGDIHVRAISHYDERMLKSLMERFHIIHNT